MRNKWVVHPLVDARTVEKKLEEAWEQSRNLAKFRQRRATQANQPRKRLMTTEVVVKLKSLRHPKV